MKMHLLVVAVACGFLAGCGSSDLEVEGESNIYVATDTLARIHEEGLITDPQYETLRKKLVDWFASEGQNISWRNADIVNTRVGSLGRRLRELRQAKNKGLITEDEFNQIRGGYVKKFDLSDL